MPQVVVSALASGIGAGFSTAGSGFAWGAFFKVTAATPVLTSICTQLPEVPE